MRAATRSRALPTHLRNWPCTRSPGREIAMPLPEHRRRCSPCPRSCDREARTGEAAAHPHLRMSVPESALECEGCRLERTADLRIASVPLALAAIATGPSCRRPRSRRGATLSAAPCNNCAVRLPARSRSIMSRHPADGDARCSLPPDSSLRNTARAGSRSRSGSRPARDRPAWRSAPAERVRSSISTRARRAAARRSRGRSSHAETVLQHPDRPGDVD